MSTADGLCLADEKWDYPCRLQDVAWVARVSHFGDQAIAASDHEAVQDLTRKRRCPGLLYLTPNERALT